LAEARAAMLARRRPLNTGSLTAARDAWLATAAA
jgi:hypothetical protein